MRAGSTRTTRRRGASAGRATRARAVLAAAAAGGVLALSGVLVTGAGAEPPATRLAASETEQATEEPDTTVEPDANGDDGAAAGTGTADPDDPAAAEPAPDELTETPQAVAFLDTLRAADVPASRRGLIEVQVAQAVCDEDAKGTDHDEMAQGIPSVLPTVTSTQAATLIDAAIENYC